MSFWDNLFGPSATTTTQTNNLPPGFQDIYNQLGPMVQQQLTQSPDTFNWQGPYYAGMAPQQQQALSGVSNQLTYGPSARQGALGSALNMVNGAAQPIQAGQAGMVNPYGFGSDASNIGPMSQYRAPISLTNMPQSVASQSDIDQRMSPYINDVANATKADLTQQYGEQQAASDRRHALARSAGDAGVDISDAELAGQQARNTASTMSNLYNSGYQGALGQYNTDVNRTLSAGLANAGMANTGAQFNTNAALTGALQQAGLSQNNSQFNANNAANLARGNQATQLSNAQLGLTGNQFNATNALNAAQTGMGLTNSALSGNMQDYLGGLSAGQVGQSDLQNQLNSAIQQYTQTAQMPRNNLSYVSNLLNGSAKNLGTTTTAPGPSPVNSLLGTGLLGAGIYNSFFARGGAIPRYGFGGGIEDWSSMDRSPYGDLPAGRPQSPSLPPPDVNMSWTEPSLSDAIQLDPALKELIDAAAPSPGSTVQKLGQGALSALGLGRLATGVGAFGAAMAPSPLNVGEDAALAKSPGAMPSNTSDPGTASYLLDQTQSADPALRSSSYPSRFSQAAKPAATDAYTAPAGNGGEDRIPAPVAPKSQKIVRLTQPRPASRPKSAVKAAASAAALDPNASLADAVSFYRMRDGTLDNLPARYRAALGLDPTGPKTGELYADGGSVDDPDNPDQTDNEDETDPAATQTADASAAMPLAADAAAPVAGALPATMRPGFATLKPQSNLDKFLASPLTAAALQLIGGNRPGLGNIGAAGQAAGQAAKVNRQQDIQEADRADRNLIQQSVAKAREAAAQTAAGKLAAAQAQRAQIQAYADTLPPDKRAMFMADPKAFVAGSMRTPKTVQTAEGVFVMNPDGTSGARIGSPVDRSTRVQVNLPAKNDAKAEEEYYIGLVKNELDPIISAGTTASNNRRLYGQMLDVLPQINTGTGAQTTKDISKALMGVGIDPKSLGLPDNVGATEFFQSAALNAARHMRQPGEGTISDYDAKQFTQMAPSLANTKPGNTLIATVGLRTAERDQKLAEDAKAVMLDRSKPMPQRVAEVGQLRSARDAMPMFTPDERKTFGIAPQGAAPRAPAAIAAPAAVTPPAGAPPEAKQAPDGKWYVPDTNRPGKYLMVQ